MGRPLLSTKIQVTVTLYLIAALSLSNPGAQEKNVRYLREIAGDIGNYRGKIVTMELKLKELDSVFERITFYDSKNHDIVFDISSKEKKKSLKSALLNLHCGMNYHVTFRVNDVGSLGTVMGELVDFSPVFMKVLP
jgi:hypothetical protein